MKLTSLSDWFLNEGVVQPTGSDHPFWADDPNEVWWIANGSLDLFLVLVSNGEAGARQHFLRAGPGHILFGLARALGSQEVRFLAVGPGESKVYRLARSRLLASATEDSRVQPLAEAVDRWVAALYQHVNFPTVPRECQRLLRGQTVELKGEEVARPQTGVLWITHVRGRSRLGNLADLVFGSEVEALPLSPAAWIQAVEPATLMAADTRSLILSGRLWTAWPSLDTAVRTLSSVRVREAAAQECQRFVLSSDSRVAVLDRALRHLSRPLANVPPIANSPAESEDALVGVARALSEALGTNIELRGGVPGTRDLKDGRYHPVGPTQVRLRRVMLKGDWWKHDSGPLLAYLRANNQPVALLPTSSSRYFLADPVRQTRQRVNRAAAEALGPVAHTFYRSFRERAPTFREVFRFGLQGAGPDMRVFLLLSLVGGLLAMALPLATGVLFDTVIPANYRPELWFVCLVLLVAGFSSVIFDLTRDIALLRIEAKSDATIQSAVWDRLLRLPIPFFRDFTAGDLAMRANGINTIQQILSGAAITSLLGGVFSAFNFGLLFAYSVRLALIATVLVMLNIVLTTMAAWSSLRLQRRAFEIQGKIAGQVLQFITGITKLRVAGAELRAFAVWAKAFGEQKRVDLHLGAIANRMTVFNQSFPLLTSICLFGVVAAWTEPGLTTGKFLAFTMAFTTFLYAGIAASHALISLLQAVPIYERSQPILQALPEVRETKTEPGELRGSLELSHISFRYKPNGPLILSDVCFHVAPGEFVAIVGPSGAGKSTILRLLLGFETPEAGTILYDGVDLAGLDVQAVRRQMGVALQNGRLMPGDIFENVVGSGLFTLDDAWDAIRKAGLEEDVLQLPMGVHTILGENAGTLSAGQRQRLMIARAIVAKPRILLFDEATSALDNRTQAIVCRSLKQLQATRLVIAHRLSTIMNADRVLVLEQGRIAQTGSFEDLSRQSGPFADLVRRQVI